MGESCKPEHRREKKYPDKGIIHWAIYPQCCGIDHIEIWGDNVQKAESLNELLGKSVFARIFMKNLLTSTQKEEDTTINLIGHDGNTPIIELGNRKICVRTIEKIAEWPGYEYPPFKKAPK